MKFSFLHNSIFKLNFKVPHSGNQSLKKFSFIHFFEENETTFIGNWHNLEDFRASLSMVGL
jgi:hypothetical protein